MDTHLKKLKQIAQDKGLAVVVGTEYNVKSPWGILKEKILDFLSQTKGVEAKYIEQIRERNLPTEAFFRILYEYYMESLLPIFKTFHNNSLAQHQKQIALLVKKQVISFLGLLNIDNTLEKANLKEGEDYSLISQDSKNLPIVSFFNGRIGQESWKDNLENTDNNYLALSDSAEKFFRGLKNCQAILVIGLGNQDFAWKNTYGNLLNLAKQKKKIYWICEEEPIWLKHIIAISGGAVLRGKKEEILNQLLEEFEEEKIESTESNFDFSDAEAEFEKWEDYQKLYCVSVFLKNVVSRAYSYKIFEKLTGMHQKKNRQAEAALCFRRMGQILFEQGFLERSIETHIIAVDYWTQAKDRKQLAREYILLGDNYSNGNSYERSSQNYEASLSLYRQLKDVKGISEAASKLALIYDEEGDYESSKKYYQESLEATQKCKNATGEILTLLNFSTTLIKSKDWELALNNLQRALTMFECEHDNFYIGEIYQHLGLVNMNLQKYKEAREYYEKVHELYKNQCETLSLTFVYCNLGHVCARLEDYDMAVKYYEEALENYEKMGDWQHLATVYNNLGFINSNRQDYSSAEEYFSRAAEIFAALSDVYNLIRTHSNLARVYTMKGESENAAECYQANIEMLQQLGEKEDLASTLVALAMVQLQTQDYEDAISHLNRAVSLYETLGQNQSKEETLKIIQTIEQNIISDAEGKN